MIFSNFIEALRFPFRKDKKLRSELKKILGFYPGNIDHYRLALSHKSAVRRASNGKRINNERLEFLGDAILDAIVGDIVYEHFPGKPEGFLTNTRSKLVKRETLGKLAKETGLDKLIITGSQHTAHNSYMGGNAFEALVGAIYLDKGYYACMRFMKKRILKQMINIDKVAKKETNFKSKLLEWSQKNRIQMKFNLIEQKTDTDSSPIFKYEVVLEDTIKGATGSGYSKKEAQQAAAKGTLQMLRRDVKMLDSVFAAKTGRTKMEEEPVMSLPEVNDGKDEEQPVKDEASKTTAEEPAKEKSERRKPQREERKAKDEEQETKGDEEKKDDEFDLSDIRMKRLSHEDIIAAAEEAAWNEG